MNDRPEPGKVYALTGLGPSIANGNTWAESEHVHTIAAYGARSIQEEHQAWVVGNTPCIFCGALPHDKEDTR